LTPAFGAPPSYFTGMVVSFAAAAANTGATTINLNSLGAKNLFRITPGGAGAMTGGEIQSGQVVVAIYDGTQFQMISVPGLTSIGWELNTSTCNNPATTCTASCTGTKKVTGGGAVTTGSAPNMVYSYPNTNASWTVGYAAAPVTAVVAYAICGFVQ
jgi:hypothetical protein